MAKPLKLTHVLLREALDFALPTSLSPLMTGWTGSVDEETGILVLRFTDERFDSARGTYRMSVHSPQIRYWRVSGAKVEALE